MDLKTKLLEYNETLKDWHDRIGIEDMVLKATIGNINADLTEILKEDETSEKPALNIADVSVSFTANDVDGAYLLGVFNVSGIDGLQKEISRIKDLGLNPNEFLTILKNER